MRGAATATKIQNRTMPIPIVALRERRKSVISFRNRLPSDDEGRFFPSGSRVAAGCGVSSGIDSEMSLILLTLFQLGLIKPKAGIQKIHADVRYCLGCHCYKGQY